MPKEHKLQIIPLGGLGEVGKNMTIIRYGNQMIMIDAGLAFPEDDLLGIDIVIPDYSYVTENKEQLLGILLTHGHEDHIGTIPYLLKDIDVPIFGTTLTMGLIQARLKENNINSFKGNNVKPGDSIKLGSFKIEFIRVSHSIPDAVGLAIHTPLGTIVHTGDFKLDHTPVTGEILDIYKFAELGQKGVLCLMSDSTNVERPGFTMSERTVGQMFDEVFRNAKERIILASFASNVHRVQQVIDAAFKNNRKVAIVGRSMLNYATIAAELGYLNIPEECFWMLMKLLSSPITRFALLQPEAKGSQCQHLPEWQ